MSLRRRTIHKFKTFAWFAVVYSAIGILWEYVEMSNVSLNGPGAGLAVGLTLAVVEESRIAHFTRSMSFSTAILAKSLVYLAVIAVPVVLTGFVFGLVDGHALSDFFAWILSPGFVIDLVLIYAIHLTIVFARHLNKLLGPGTLMRYITGRYHKPSSEKRVFMFLDLKSSTMLTEAMGQDKYYAFLNAFFRDLSEPIVDRSAEIYQYVGDEVILSWPFEDGVRDANCVRIFIEIMAQIQNRREDYLTDFGHVPQFKAGVHYGDVIAAEIGDIKKEISYFGDVLNTTERIQAKCNELGHLLIASEELVATVQMPLSVTPEPLGRVALRGKSEATALVGLYAA